MADIRLQLDEKTQVIYQWVEGDFSEKDSDRIVAMIGELKPRLRDPDRIRILALSEKPGKPTPSARRSLLENAKREDLYKMAIAGGNPYMKALVSFFCIASGMKKVRAFTKESDALQWLVE